MWTAKAKTNKQSDLEALAKENLLETMTEQEVIIQFSNTFQDGSTTTQVELNIQLNADGTWDWRQ